MTGEKHLAYEDNMKKKRVLVFWTGLKPERLCTEGERE